MLRTIILASFILISLDSKALEKSRPNSEGGEYLFELVAGYVFEDHEDVFEIGFDIERFIEDTDHHFAVGLSMELEFPEKKNHYFLGPMFSAYYYHFKLFIASGVLTDFEGHSKWKTRLGVGYEFIFYEEWLLIPSVAIDIVNSEVHPAASIGFAHEL